MTVSDPTYRFNDADRTIDILRPDLPSPWINYLSNGSLHAFVSQCNGGTAWWKTAQNMRLTRYRGWSVPGDGPGFYLYVREPDGTMWSPSFKPCETPLDSFVCTHAPGATTFRGRRGALEIAQTVFVAPDADVLVWSVDVRNHGKKPLEADLFGYVEFALFPFALDSSWGYYCRYDVESFFDDSSFVGYAYHTGAHEAVDGFPLLGFGTDRPLAGWTGGRTDFLGWSRSERNPRAVEEDRCGGRSLEGGEPCGALQTKFTVAPGRTERVHFFLALAPDGDTARPAAQAELRRRMAAYRAPGWADSQAAKLRAWWDEHFAPLSVDIPADPACARQMSVWTPVNCVATGRFSRSFSQYAAGMRGFGFRDTAQDMLALVARRPDWARAEFLRLLRYQHVRGDTVHAYFPYDRQDPWGGPHSDDALWLPMLAHALVSETGDLGLLDERVPYLGRDNRTPLREATVWEHLLAALSFTARHFGAHGLPLTLASDWNDCMGRFAKARRGESVMVAEQYLYDLGLMAGLARARGETKRAAAMESRRATLAKAFAKTCWDGAWWIRAFDDEGRPVGSRTNEFGRIWLNSQTWAVLAGMGDAAQRRGAMDRVAEMLDTSCGIRKLTPSYPPLPDPRGLSGYCPGTGENGAIFCHANTWAVIAEALLGRPDRAWAYFRALVPDLALRKVGLDRYQCEPYAYASSIIGPENGQFGLATLTHVTGTAAWMDIAGTQYLLGIRPELDGLRLAPCLASDIPGYKAIRIWAGCRLSIEVARESGRSGTAVRSATLDGAPLPLDGITVLLSRACLSGKTSASIRLTIG